MKKYIHAFWHIKDTDYGKLEKINNCFHNFQYAWEKAEPEELQKAGLDKAFIEQILALRNKLDLPASLDRLWRADIVPVDQCSPEFPEELKSIDAPPFLLYRKGADLDNLPNRIAIVGTRKSTSGGEKLAFSLAGICSQNNLTVVSGLAFGIDASAHSGVLRQKGKTIGVLASGIAQITPSSHYNLAEIILETGGSIISEYPVTSPAFKFRFLERNRIISGLCHTTVVVEAGKKSGALITAEHALNQHREILAFPGDPGKTSSIGCNNLIKDGEAHLAGSIADVLQFLADKGKIPRLPEQNRTAAACSLDLTDLRVVELLNREKQTTDQLQLLGRLEWTELMQSLSKLEIAGVVEKNAELKWQLLAD
jgi:DNA processing protein